VDTAERRMRRRSLERSRGGITRESVERGMRRQLARSLLRAGVRVLTAGLPGEKSANYRAGFLGISNHYTGKILEIPNSRIQNRRAG
jgi:hypothetical protein